MKLSGIASLLVLAAAVVKAVPDSWPTGYRKDCGSPSHLRHKEHANDSNLTETPDSLLQHVAVNQNYGTDKGTTSNMPPTPVNRLYSSDVPSAATTTTTGVGSQYLPISSLNTPSGQYNSPSSVSTSLQSTGAFSAVPSLAWKAGLSGFPDIEKQPVFSSTWLPYVSWYSNYNPITPDFAYTASSGIDARTHKVVGTPMLWGDKICGGEDVTRYNAFMSEVVTGQTNPSIFFGFFEPDCNCATGSSQIADIGSAVDVWNEHISTLYPRGISLGSPSVCKQTDEDWLATFSESVTWNITSVHVNKKTPEEGIAVIEYFWKTFGKPIWITELTCVDDSDWSSPGGQDVVNAFIDGMIPFMEDAPYVLAYGANNGEGVPEPWPLMDSKNNYALTDTGTHYLNTIKQYAHPKVVS